jgi:hypothetical protein
VREKLVDFLQKECPQALPRQRTEVAMEDEAGNSPGVRADGRSKAKTPKSAASKAAEKP